MLSLALLLACAGGGADSGLRSGDTAATDGGAALDIPPIVNIPVLVTLDGAPVEGAVLAQGGNPARWTTGADGTVIVSADSTVEGDQALMGNHPEARVGVVELDDYYEAAALGQSVPTATIALERYDPSDNLDYSFQDPGEPERRDTTNQCAHCHVTINQDWFDSPHARSASNPVVQDIFAGTAHALGDADSCRDAGGQWWTGLEPGTGEPVDRCYLGAGALPDLNSDCGDSEPCDQVATETGGCAACHAPGIDGQLEGRSLLEATDLAYDYGVHCDVCHRMAAVDLDEPQPGVGGRVQLVRPSEPGSGTFVWDPLFFGPYADVPNPRMGSVALELFYQADLCAGCHQHDAEVLVPGEEIDRDRWPDGRLPVQSTYAEWLAGPYGSADGDSGAPCQSCHMPADADVGNSADLGNVLDGVDPGIAAGWWREPGEVRRHSWFGPRSDEQRMIDLAAALWLDASQVDGQVVVDATVKNVGPGHALPTGEPMRHLVLVLQARCDGEQVSAVGGDVVTEDGGWLDRKEAGEDWTLWPGAEVGQVIRVVQRSGAWHDYTGYGSFGDGRFDAQAKGLPEELAAGQATIVAVDGDVVTLDGTLPEGSVAYRVDGIGLPTEGAAALAWAGAPGFTFGRVMVDADGQRMVPHHRAVDVLADNRLLPQQSWTSSHTFPSCDSGLQIDAVLLYRAWPLWLAKERGWGMSDQVMASAWVEVAT